MWSLIEYGWDKDYEKVFNSLADSGEFGGKPDLEPARVCSEQKNIYRLISRHGEISGEVSGKFRFNAAGTGDFPAVGDWVAAEIRPGEGNATIHAVLPRRSKFSRKAAGGRPDEQIAAANFDYVFIIASLNHDLNSRRLERYLTAAWESGGLPVLILSKADLSEDTDSIKLMMESTAPGVPVHAVSALSGHGLDELSIYTSKGKTIVFMGSSGVGKSTLLNRLAGNEIMEVNDIREDDSKGRHTTTYRQLALVPSGCMIIDTPGMRELTVWDGDEGIGAAFNDIEELGRKCRFRDCRHGNEPGCAVNEAVRAGTLSAERLAGYIKLQKEISFLERKKGHKLVQAGKVREKALSKSIRNYSKY